MTVVANTPGATKVAGIMLGCTRTIVISLIGGIT